MEDLCSFGNNLMAFITKNQPNQAETLISEVNKIFTETELESITLDSYILSIFNKNNGLVSFLNETLHKSEYKKAKLKCLELLYALVNNCMEKVNVYLPDIIKATSPIVRSSATAIEKQKSLQLITLIIQKGKIHDDAQRNIEVELAPFYSTTLLKCLHSRFDKSNTVQEELLVTIGAIAKKFPAIITNPEELQNTLLIQLNKEMFKPNKSYPIIAGAVIAISNYLESFPFDPNKDKATADSVYKCVKVLADPGDASRRIAFREGLMLLTKHVVLFANLLYGEARWWHERLLKWFHLGVEDKKVAYGILDAFYREMANLLSGKNQEYDCELFKYFLSYFLEAIQKPNSDNYEMQLSIRGIGLLARSFPTHATPLQINQTFTTISQIMEYKYILNYEHLTSDQIMYLPHFLQTLSFITKILPQLSNIHLTCLQRITVLIIKIFPQVSPVQHHLVFDALVITFFQLQECKGTVLEHFLQDVVYQGVLWTCSHKIALNTDDSDSATYKIYLPLWNTLLKITDSLKYEKYDINLEKRKSLVKRLLNQLLTTLFVIINKLNLETKVRDDALALTDPEMAYEAVQINDFVIFVNVVDFYQDIMETIDARLFQTWINVFLNRVLVKLIRHHLVSGFYKLLASCLKICDRLDYFDDSKIADNETLRITYETLCRFLAEMLWRMRQFKGDLQLASLRVILALPMSLVRFILPFAASSFVSLFSVGRSYLTLADLAIDTLQKWLKEISCDEMRDFLKQILPALDSYLRISRSLGGFDKSLMTINKNKRVQKRRVLVQSDRELLALQMKILTFIGQLDDDLCMEFVSSRDCVKPVVWNKTAYLKITLPYANNTKINMYLDRFVPRIVELAMFSSDRKIRVAASELLHAIVMVTLGTAHSMDPTKTKDLDCLVKAIFLPVIHLGCDADQLIQQLFYPLALQMMHYYSHPREMYSSHTHIMVETLIESIANPTDSALRDFAGTCIKEFVTWTIKQSDRDDLLKAPINVKVWIRTIQSFSVHPDSFKRLASALIFNNIYTLLREETHLFDMFWFEVLYAFIVNLSLTQESNSDDNNCIRQVSEALNHVERGITEKFAIFNIASSSRRKPPAFEGNLLKDAAIWLLKNTGSLNIECRRKSMSVFCKVAPLTNRDRSLESFNQMYIADDAEWVLRTYERELQKIPTLCGREDTDGLFKWLRSLLCAIDGYIFVIDHKLLSTSHHWEKSTFFVSLQFYLEFVAQKTIVDLTNGGNYTWTDKESFKKLNAMVSAKTIELFNVAIQDNFVPQMAQLFSGSVLCNFICSHIFEPSLLGFDIIMTTPRDENSNNKRLLELLNKMNDCCSLEIVGMLTNFLSMYIVNNFTHGLELVVGVKQKLLIKGMLFLDGPGCLLRDKLHIAIFFTGTIKELKDHLINKHGGGVAAITKLSKNMRDYCVLKLEGALKYDFELHDMMGFLCDETIVLNQEQEHNLEVEYGFYFFRTFETVLIEYILKNYSLFIDKLFEQSTVSFRFKYLGEVLRYLDKNRRSIDHCVTQGVVKMTLDNTARLLDYFNGDSIRKLSGIEFINKLAFISPEPLCNLIAGKDQHRTLLDWVVSLLFYEDVQWPFETGIAFKSEVLVVLPHVFGAATTHETELRNGMRHVQNKYFCGHHEDSQSIPITTTLKKLFEFAKTTKSELLLTYALKIYVTSPLLYVIDDIDLTFSLKPFMRVVHFEQQASTLRSIYNLCMDCNTFTPMQRYLLTKTPLMISLQNCDYSVFEEFYIKIVKSILATLVENNPIFNMADITNKTINYLLAEFLFSRIKMEDDSCPITKAAFPEETTSRTLVKTLTQYALKVTKEKYALETQEERETYRLYQCHCYNALVSLISNTQKEITYYTWLFTREENNRDILWEKLVDVEFKYSFDLEFDVAPSMKKVLVSIRRDLLEARKNVDSEARTVKYIESQHLFNSTLNEDVTRFDFTFAALRSQQRDERDNANSVGGSEMEVMLENIDLDKHECMPIICGLIQHMVDNGVILLPDLEEKNVVLPKWLKGIRNVMMDDATRKNVKIFLTKVIFNSQNVFKHYAKWFFAPIIKVVVDGCLGNVINYFVADLVIMVTTWSRTSLPTDDKELASALLKFLIKNVDNKYRVVFKRNLELIKLVLEAWKSCITIPYDLLYLNLQMDITSKQLDVGIHVIATILANDIPPWPPTELKNFLMSLTKILKSTHRNVYQPTSEVLGMSLRYISSDPKYLAYLEGFREFLHKFLMKLINEDDKFAYCLQGLVLYQPPIADQYLCQMISKLPHLHGNFKCIYLKIFLSRIEALHNLNELSSLPFESLLAQDDAETQLLVLEIIEKSVKHLDEKKLLPLLQNVAKLSNSSFRLSRNVVYDIFISAFNNHRSELTELTRNIIALSKDTLLQGLIDKDQEIQEKVFGFWLNVTNSSRDVAKIFLELLNRLYKPDIEEHYVCYSTYILLNNLKGTAEYSEKIFEHALYECEFQDYKLVSHWRYQHASITPLFTNTLKSQSSTVGSLKLDVLRASAVSLEFQPTQAVSNSPMSINHFEKSSSLFISSLATKSDNSSDGIFKDPNEVLAKSQVVRSRRFLKDKSQVSRHCAYLEVKKSLKAEASRKENVKQNERNVTVYREYRIGDYPDVEITLAAVIEPLQMLARADASLARNLYTTLFTCYLTKYKDEEDGAFMKNVNTSIEEIFSTSTQFVPNTMGTFLDIALQHKADLKFQPNTIANVCRSSGLFSLGSLLLEEYLISDDADYTTPAKRRRGVENHSDMCWIKLAELYKEMEEWDVVRAIFLEKLNCSGTILSAIEAESSQQWRMAQEFYGNVIGEEPSQERKDFYYESYFKCFAALAEWDKLSDVIEQTVLTNSADDIWSTLWNDDWNRDKLLPWYIKAELRNTLYVNDKKLFVYVNESLNNPEKLEHLKANFSEELAMLWLLQNDVTMASYYLKSGVTTFLENWSHLNPLFIKLGVNKVLNLKNIIDIDLFLMQINNLTFNNWQNVCEDLVKSWNTTTATNVMDSLLLNETKIVYRNQFLSTLNTKMESISVNDADLNGKLRRCKFQLHMNLVESALDQENYYVARKYIKLSAKPNVGDIMEKMRWTLALSKILFLRAQTVTDNNEGRLSLTIDSWAQIGLLSNSCVADDDTLCYFIKTTEHVYNLTQSVYKTLLADPSLLNNKKLTQLQAFLRDSPALENPEEFWKFGTKTLLSTLDLCENNVQLMMNNENLKVYKHMANAYVKLAYSTQNKGNDYEETFIMSVLRSMKFGSVEGRKLFPCLLNKAIGTTFKEMFTKETAHIPTWMFLGWLSQLLANVDTFSIFGIADILLEIAKTYPQAIMYAYRLSREKYKFDDHAVEVFGRGLLETLDGLLLNDDLIDKFLKSLSCISAPANILRYHIEKLIKAASTSNASFQQVLRNLLDDVFFETADYKNVKSFQGAMFKKIEKYEKKIRNLEKRKYDVSYLEKALKDILDEVKNLDYKRSSLLIDYTPWLTNFQDTPLHANLEIPGQYTGEKIPLTQYHTKIMGFSPTVDLLTSLRAPIKITILGNDAKEYGYLVKFGEDLRQDQRIEQIFNLMNDILSHDRNCHNPQLSLHTYQVVPLNTRLGIIEWINGSRELKKFIEDGINEEEKVVYSNSEKEYSKWIAKALPRNKTSFQAYGFACTKYTRDNTIVKYMTLVNSLPLDVLRRSFRNISVDSESFFALRQKFTTSYALMCVSHWLLGIGDRHLSNSLVLQTSGEVIGIDFGHAFGTATQILQVPELVPFRLTPHILHLFQPLGERGVLQETMIHSLGAFRKKSNILLTTMNIFIKEPSLDWLEFAYRSELTSGRAINQEIYANGKIQHAQRKLQGANPTSIMIEELKAGHSHTEFLKAYVDLVRGLPQYNFRTGKGDELSEEDQVKCLIDQSTDYNLLGRMWVGWQAWV